MKPLVLFKSEEKTDTRHLKQMMEGLINNSFFYLALFLVVSDKKKVSCFSLCKPI